METVGGTAPSPRVLQSLSVGQWSTPEAGPQAAPRPPLEMTEPQAGWQRKDHTGLGTCRLWLWPASPWMDKCSGERLQGSGRHPSWGWWGQLPLHPHLGASPPSESCPCVPPEHRLCCTPTLQRLGGPGQVMEGKTSSDPSSHMQGQAGRHSPTHTHTHTHTHTPILPSPMGASQPSQHTAAEAVILSWGPGDIIYHPPDT